MQSIFTEQSDVKIVQTSGNLWTKIYKNLTKMLDGIARSCHEVR